MPQKSIFLVIKWGTVCFGFLFSNAFTSRKINTDDSTAAVRQVVKLVERASKRHKGWDPTTTATSTNASNYTLLAHMWRVEKQSVRTSLFVRRRDCLKKAPLTLYGLSLFSLPLQLTVSYEKGKPAQGSFRVFWREFPMNSLFFHSVKFWREFWKNYVKSTFFFCDVHLVW